MLLRLQQSSVHSSVFHFHFIVFVATPLVVMAIGMKLWFKKLGMNQTIYRSDEGLTLETSAFLLFTVANLRFQPSC